LAERRKRMAGGSSAYADPAGAGEKRRKSTGPT